MTQRVYCYLIVGYGLLIVSHRTEHTHSSENLHNNIIDYIWRGSRRLRLSGSWHH